MTIQVIQQRLDTYKSTSQQEEHNALKEISQEIALSALARTDFFQHAVFQGGTCLRIIYGLNRFSEDLDFVLQKQNAEFRWNHYSQVILEEFATYGCEVTINDRSKADKVVKKAFIKDDSIGKILTLQYRESASYKFQIKLEVDTNPPDGSELEIKYLDFPLPTAISVQNLPSLFASKSHALLCREYTKGRDWYDFVWYVGQHAQFNYLLLENALKQRSPWQQSSLRITKEWYLTALENKIRAINWSELKNDVERFLTPREKETLKLWSESFFLTLTEKLTHYLNERKE